MHSASVGFHCPQCTKAGAQKVIRPGDLVNQPVVTFTLIGLCVLAFLAQTATGGSSLQTGRVTIDLVQFGPLIAHGEWWRIVTGGFLHAGLLHIGFNMYALYLFGPALEQALGRVRFALVYAGGLLGASLAVIAFDFETPTLGASGAVLGLAGGLAAVMASQGRSIFKTSLGGIFLINLLLPLIPGFRISFWGHFGGIIGGFLIAGIVAWLPNQIGGSKQAHQIAQAAAIAAVIALFAATLAIADAGGLATINI